MKFALTILSTFLFKIFLISPTQSSLTSGNIDWWCNQTPNPQPCKYHLSHGLYLQNSSSIVTKPEFLSLSKDLAIKESVSKLNYITSLGPKCLNNVEKSVWNQCLQFYQLTIHQLNQTLDKTLNPTPSDTQAWLSAALTNIRTCQSGFIDLNVTKNMYPLVISNNVTQLISNSLAINFDYTTDQNLTRSIQKFPSWFPAGDDRSSLLNSKLHADRVVAQDGSGNFKTIKEALEASLNRKDYSKLFIIYVKKGVYKEQLEVTRQMSNIMLVGDGLGDTIITGNKSLKDGLTLFGCSTVVVKGDGFIAKDITFENTAGADKAQAVALSSASDRSVFYRCGFKGHQDTLYVNSLRQFYKNCAIWGTVDFIFGNAAVVFQDCNIYVRKPAAGGGLVITAQNRATPHESTGISIQRCKIIATPHIGPYRAYLGRPWANYSRTVYLQSDIGDFVDPAGWMRWETRSINSIYFGEYENKGKGALTDNRVNWPGYHRIQSKATANMFTVKNLIQGHTWLRATGVPFTSGL